MLGILGNLKLIVALAGAAGLLFIGYTLGARKVGALEAQIAEIRHESDDAAGKLRKSQDEIVQALKAREEEYARQSAQLKSEADQKAKELAAALSGANSRIAVLQAEVSTVDARRARLVADRDAASTVERRKLQEQIDALDREKKDLLAKVDANACLALAVPDPVIGPLLARVK